MNVLLILAVIAAMTTDVLEPWREKEMLALVQLL